MAAGSRLHSPVRMVREGGDTPSFSPLEDVRAVWLGFDWICGVFGAVLVFVARFGWMFCLPSLPRASVPTATRLCLPKCACAIHAVSPIECLTPTCLSWWAAQTWGMYFLAAFIILLIFVPVYKASVDPTIYGAKKKKSKMSGESVKKAMASKKA